VNAVKRGGVRDFIAAQLERWKPATALNRYGSLQAFFKWCVAEGELERSPMIGMKPPQLPDEPPPVLTDDQLRRLLKSCEAGNGASAKGPIRVDAQMRQRPCRTAGSARSATLTDDGSRATI
jgi:integrase